MSTPPTTLERLYNQYTSNLVKSNVPTEFLTFVNFQERLFRQLLRKEHIRTSLSIKIGRRTEHHDEFMSHLDTLFD
jgi:hypothetical protein